MVKINERKKFTWRIPWFYRTVLIVCVFERNKTCVRLSLHHDLAWSNRLLPQQKAFVIFHTDLCKFHGEEIWLFFVMLLLVLSLLFSMDLWKYWTRAIVLYTTQLYKWMGWNVRDTPQHNIKILLLKIWWSFLDFDWRSVSVWDSSVLVLSWWNLSRNHKMITNYFAVFRITLLSLSESS